MPTICEFRGISIMMYWDEGRHHRPHFHAQYAEHHAAIAIQTGDELRGKLPPPQYRLVLEWTALHRTELMNNWERLQNLESPLPIDPLD